ncbi:MAG: hypothetical protein AAB037_02220 [Chloroflexota bacterium]
MAKQSSGKKSIITKSGEAIGREGIARPRSLSRGAWRLLEGL